MHPLSPHPRRGFTFIGLLIVLVIIMILVGNQMGGTNGNPSLQKITVDRSKNAACLANRTTIVTQFNMWAIDNPGRVPTVKDLEDGRINVPRCPEGGEYTILQNGGIHCTKHDEPIGDVIRKMYSPQQAAAYIATPQIQDILRRYNPDSPDLIGGNPNIPQALPQAAPVTPTAP